VVFFLQRATTHGTLLDVVVSPDGTWSLKDRADFDEAIRGGFFDRAEQDCVRGDWSRCSIR
jgi:hypothetical protein